MTSDDGSAPSAESPKESPDEEPAESSDEEPGGNGSPSGQPTVTIGSEGFHPEESDETDDGGEADVADDARTTAGVENAIPDADGEFDWRGWLLVAVVVVSFLVIPIAIFLRPLRFVGFQTTYLVLPLLPALVLGATAVWVAVRGRQGDR